jgi:tetratricopeptide (TPR) repeat protein
VPRAVIIEKAWAVTERMLEFDPLSPEAHLSATYYRYLARDYKESVRWLNRAGQLGLKVPHGYRLVARALVATGRADEAIKRLEELHAESPNALVLGELADVLALTGRTTKAHQTIARIHRLPPEVTICPMAFAYAYAGLGMTGEVLDWLERAADDGWTTISCVALDPRFDLVRSDPRFQAILKRMNLA